MKWLRWSLWQMYLIFFWPSRFQREIEGFEPGQPRLSLRQRAVYLLKLSPWTVLVPVFVNLAVGLSLEAYGLPFDWETSWSSVADGVALGMALGVTLSVAFSMAFSMAFGIASGVIVGGTSGYAVVGLFPVAFVVMIATAIGMAKGVASSVVKVVASSVVLGLAYVLTLGLVVLTMPFMAARVVAGLAVGMAFALFYCRLIIYPFDCLLAVLAAWMSRRSPQAPRRAWAWHPVRWNEVIWLPLPFTADLLVRLAQQDRAYGFEQIAFVAAERRLQRRAAVRALAQIALDDLRADTLEALVETDEKMAWTRDTPTVLPEAIVGYVTDFERIARLAGQSLALDNGYRRNERIKHALEELERLQKRLIGARGNAARLLQTANQWRRLLEAESHRLAQQPMRRELPNPFVYGNPINEDRFGVFAGRKDVVRAIEAAVLNAAVAPTLLLHGPRRMGKSSILKQLPRLLGPDFAPALVDCQQPAARESLPGLLRYLSVALAEGLQRRRVEVKPLTIEDLTVAPFQCFDAWLQSMERAMPPNLRAVLCLDEYERLQSALDAGWGADFLDQLRHILQHRPRIVVMFTGARTFAELGPAWTDRFISARRLRVSFLKPDEVRPLLTRPIPEFDLDYLPGALEALIESTHCQPYLTQAVAFELVQYLNEGGRKQAAVNDVEAAVTRALESGGEYFANVWTDAGEEGQAILTALAEGRPAPESRKATRWLREHDVLNDAGNFAVPMMARWVREHSEDFSG